MPPDENEPWYSEAELEYDFCVALNMMLGETFEEASSSALEWVKEARE